MRAVLGLAKPRPRAVINRNCVCGIQQGCRSRRRVGPPSTQLAIELWTFWAECLQRTVFLLLVLLRVFVCVGDSELFAIRLTGEERTR